MVLDPLPAVIFQLHLLTTWGDPYYIGLNGLEFYDHNHEKIPLSKNSILLSKYSGAGATVSSSNLLSCHLKNLLFLSLFYDVLTGVALENQMYCFYYGFGFYCNCIGLKVANPAHYHIYFSPLFLSDPAAITAHCLFSLCSSTSLRSPDIAAFPDSVNVLDNVSGDVRTPDKLIDGVNGTNDGRHMWLAPVLPGQVSAVFFNLFRGTTHFFLH